MTWSARSVLFNAVIGAALVGVQWAVGSLLAPVLPSSGWWALLILLYFLAAGYGVAWLAPRGFGGASAGAFLGWALPARLIGGPTAQAIDLGLAIVGAGLVAIGELVALAIRPRSTKPGRV
jgi:hypothetical protein